MSLLVLRSIVGKQLPVVAGRNCGVLAPMQILNSRSYALDKAAKAALKQAQKQAKKDAAKAAEPPVAEFIKNRNVLFNTLKEKFEEEFRDRAPLSIKITLPDGKVVPGEAWESTPFEIAKGISAGLASDSLVAKANNELWDIERPLETDTKIELLKFDEPEAKAAFWRTSAFVLAETLERLYGEADKALVVKISAAQEGFYADIHLPETTITAEKVGTIDAKVKKLFQQRQKVDRIEVAKNDLLELFSYNEFVLREVEKIVKDRTAVYRCGGFLDLSPIPLLRHTKKIKVIKVLKADAINAEKIQRVHAVSFPSEQQLLEFERKQKK